MAKLSPWRQVARLLEQRGMTQVEFARQLGISEASVSRKLTGEVPFSLEQLERCASIFGVTPTALLKKAS